VAEVGAIVCGEGPGSFTSLRITAAIAKGLSHANGIPLFSVSSLLLAAASHNTPGDYLVHSDALRGERYAMRVRCDERGSWRALGPVVRVAPSDLAALADGSPELRVEAAPRAAVDGETAALVVVPHARYLKRIADWSSARPVDLAAWEPSYGRLAEAQVKWEADHQQSLSDVLLPPGTGR
jgi:tRNA threonylcarbamoyladenosine biosynthesis protein TsaB